MYKKQLILTVRESVDGKHVLEVRKTSQELVAQALLNMNDSELLNEIKLSQLHQPVTLTIRSDRFFSITFHHELTTDWKKTIEKQVSDLLISLGFSNAYKGTLLVRDAIVYMLRSDHMMNVMITKDVYPVLAAKYNIHVNNVERTMRTAIEKAWKAKEGEALRKSLGLAEHSNQNRPSNMVFIRSISLMIFEMTENDRV